MDIDFILNKMLLDVDFTILNLYAGETAGIDKEWLFLL